MVAGVERAKTYIRKGSIITFPALYDTSTGEPVHVDVSAAKPFGQPNKSGGLRTVSNVDEACAIGRGAAKSMKKRVELARSADNV